MLHGLNIAHLSQDFSKFFTIIHLIGDLLVHNLVDERLIRDTFGLRSLLHQLQIKLRHSKINLTTSSSLVDDRFDLLSFITSDRFELFGVVFYLLFFRR